MDGRKEQSTIEANLDDCQPTSRRGMGKKRKGVNLGRKREQLIKNLLKQMAFIMISPN